MTSWKFRAVIVVSGLLLAVIGVTAQSGQGSVRGYVYDGLSHSPVRGTKVSLKSIETFRGTPFSVMAETDESGNYEITQVPMGEYRLQISAKDHQPYETTILILSDAHLVMGTRLERPSHRP